MQQVNISVIMALASFLSVGSANPLAEASKTNDLVARDTIDVKLCTDTYSGGTCNTFEITTQTQCVSLSGTPQEKQTTSISFDNGYRCTFWSSSACNGDKSSDIPGPGSTDLGAQGFSDKANSFKCYVGSSEGGGSK